MRTRLLFGAGLLLLGALAATSPSLTGAVTGAPNNSAVFFISLPFVALGAAVIANALRDVFFNEV